MNFWVFMLCMVIAIFAGVVLERFINVSSLIRDYKYYDIAFENEDDAYLLIKILHDILEKNGRVRVIDMYKAADIHNTNLADRYYGWFDISDFHVKQDEKTWLVVVPKPVLFEK